MTQPDLEKMVKESPNKKCACGHEYFDRATIQKDVSPLISGTGKREVLLVEVLVCRKCGEEVKPSLIVT